MKRLLAAALMGLLLAGFTVVAAQATPGPNGSNDHGLCTAYFNGQKVGHGDGENPDRQPKPFDALEAVGRAYTDSDGADNDRNGEVDEENENSALSAAENIFNFCNDGGLIGGNPEHGRFTCSDPGASTDPECSRNEKPGNGPTG